MTPDEIRAYLGGQGSSSGTAAMVKRVTDAIIRQGYPETSMAAIDEDGTKHLVLWVVTPKPDRYYRRPRQAAKRPKVNDPSPFPDHPSPEAWLRWEQAVTDAALDEIEVERFDEWFPLKDLKDVVIAHACSIHVNGKRGVTRHERRQRYEALMPRIAEELRRRGHEVLTAPNGCEFVVPLTGN